ncbi:MAG: response regulator transcription factor [Alphaproteobacteria bacterium]|nr:response regulator transcription factor [Alphaproteobacteria bacterium]
MVARDPVEILVVDDEPEIRTLLREYFELEGYHVSEAKDGAELRGHLDKHPVTLITLDVNLPGEDGFALSREIRTKRNVPIVMISGKQDPIDRIVGLELGADDYITKPFHLREVLARVRAVLRRYQPEDRRAASIAGPRNEERYRFEGFELFPQRRELLGANGHCIELTTAEFNLLEMFAARPSRVMTRDNIMDVLKGHDWSPLDRSIDTLVARLRKKIEPDPDHPKLIKTVRAVGYVFAVEVQKS